jgi:hypothetical protein
MKKHSKRKKGKSTDESNVRVGSFPEAFRVLLGEKASAP